MIKNLKQNDIQTTPFVVKKPWVLTNFHNNDDLLLTEDGYPIALEFVDYGSGEDLPIYSGDCNVSLETKTIDKVLYEEGEKIDGQFDVDSDPKNNTGTYKRLIYTQIKNAFYNNLNDPTKIFGMENLDFQLSNTRKFLSNDFRLFSISKNKFGEKILENSVVLVDNSLDDKFEIIDDGYGNIIAKQNLFSKIQEVGNFNNIISDGDSGNDCSLYYYNDPPTNNTSETVTPETISSTKSNVVSLFTSYGGTSSSTLESWITDSMTNANTLDYAVIDNKTWDDSYISGIGFAVKGSGSLYINWGDTIETYELSDTEQYIVHNYNLSTVKSWHAILIGNITSFIAIDPHFNTESDFGGNICHLTHLKFWQAFGNNVLDGDVTNMTSLEYLECHGFTTIYGDISNLINLYYLNISNAYSTVTGTLEKLTKLQYVATYQNDLSHGKNTITGFDKAAVNAIHLSEMIQGPDKLTSYQVDTILAGLVMNAYQTKPLVGTEGYYETHRLEVSLENDSTSLPSAQGLTDIATLQSLGWDVYVTTA